jgi:hypothetical protein
MEELKTQFHIPDTIVGEIFSGDLMYLDMMRGMLIVHINIKNIG